MMWGAQQYAILALLVAAAVMAVIRWQARGARIAAVTAAVIWLLALIAFGTNFGDVQTLVDCRDSCTLGQAATGVMLVPGALLTVALAIGAAVATRADRT